jgi:hypothetical protein
LTSKKKSAPKRGLQFYDYIRAFSISLENIRDKQNYISHPGYEFQISLRYHLYYSVFSAITSNNMGSIGKGDNYVLGRSLMESVRWDIIALP